MLRRNFLKALAAAVLMPSMVVNATPAPIAINPHQKYIDALALYDVAVAVNTQYRANLVAHPLNPDQVEVSDALVQEHGNTFLAFLMANFQKPPARGEPEFEYEREQVMLILDMNHTTNKPCAALLRNVPPKVAEVAWVIAAVKSLLSEQRMYLIPPKCPAFAEFVAQYREIIIYS